MDVFQQQGQLDYVAMSNSVISNTVVMAQRLAAAGISQITHDAGLAMSTRFRLGPMGQMRVSEALNNLRPYFGFERALWFGFGHKSFLALLTEHQAGFNCAALCASLAEVYGNDRSAQLLQALWRVQGLSEFLEPSRTQFRALVNGCSGLFLATPFPDVVRRMAGPYADDDYEIVAGAEARSEDWAKAVDAIFQISKGNLKAIRVYGGRDVAFLGAIAHWLFDLRVWLELPGGTVKFSNCRSPEQANVYLHYADMGPTNALLKIDSTTFVLRSIEDLIVDDLECLMTFRIQWSSCLSELFPDEVDAILDNVTLIGRVLGGIARIYEALRKCEIDVGGLSRTHFINYQPAGYGRGFIDNVCNLLPEIGASSVFRTTALKSVHSDVPHCIETICDSTRDMAASCGCSSCGSSTVNGYHHCHVAVLFFIRTVANVMAHTNIKSPTHPISPSRSGLERIYGDCRQVWISSKSRECSSLLEFASGLPHAEQAGQGRNTYSKDFLLDSVLQGAARIYIGPTNHKEFGRSPRTHDEPQCTAISKNGVCLWIDALRNLSVDPATMATIHIAPGQIVYKDWNYTSIWDLSHAGKELSSFFTPVDFGERPTTTLQEEPNQPHDALRILAQERAESGTIRLVYGLNEKTFERTLQPGIITEEILMATARVPCPQGATCSDEIALPCWQRRSGWNFESSPIGIPSPRPGEIGSVGFIWSASSPLSKLLAIECCRTLAWYNHKLFNFSANLIRSDQCMACMTRYTMTFKDQASWEHFLYYRGKQERQFSQRDLLCALHII